MSSTPITHSRVPRPVLARVGLVVIALLVGWLLYSHSSGRRNMTAVAAIRLRHTVFHGLMLQDRILQAFEVSGATGSGLTLSTLSRLYADGELSERLSKGVDSLQPGSSRIVLYPDGRGGWWVNTNTLELRINSTNRFYLNRVCSAWIPLDRVRFTPSIQLPVEGDATDRSQQFIKLLIEDGTLVKRELAASPDN